MIKTKSILEIYFDRISVENEDGKIVVHFYDLGKEIYKTESVYLKEGMSLFLNDVKGCFVVETSRT